MTRGRTPARMARLVAQWHASGSSQAAFARQHRIPTWTFWYWCRKLAGAPTAQAAESNATPFVPVRLMADAAAPVLEITLSEGAHVRVRAGASADVVRAAVMALCAKC
jgi:hypothetical protein